MNTYPFRCFLILAVCGASALTARADEPEDKVVRVPFSHRVVVVTTEEKLAQTSYPGYLAVSGPPAVRLYRQPPTPRPRRTSDPAHRAGQREKELQQEKDKAAAAAAKQDATAAATPIVTAKPVDPAAAPTDAAAGNNAASPAPDVLSAQQATDPHDRTEELLSYFQRQKAAAAAAAAGAPGGVINGEPEPSFLQPAPSSLAPIAPAPPSRATYHVEP